MEIFRVLKYLQKESRFLNLRVENDDNFEIGNRFVDMLPNLFLKLSHSGFR